MKSLLVALTFLVSISFSLFTNDIENENFQNEECIENFEELELNENKGMCPTWFCYTTQGGVTHCIVIYFECESVVIDKK